MKNRDAIPQEQEHKDIRATREYVKQNGPLSISELVDASVGPSDEDDLRRAGLTREQQVRRIISSMDGVGMVNYVTDEYIEWEGDV